MTIAICLKVGDGVVLGTDSATSLIGANNEYYNIYLSAEKTVNLVKGLPVGMMTYGLGGLRGRSIASLARDLRIRLSGGEPAHIGWSLDPHGYTMQQVAQCVKDFFYDEFYVPEFVEPAQQGGGGPPNDLPGLGFMIAGFSANAPHAEVWTVEVDSGGICHGPDLLHGQDEVGVLSWRGQPEALDRLVFGWSEEAVGRLLQAGVPRPVAIQVLNSYTRLAHPAMPIQDAIDLVRYLANVTVGFVRFKPGPPTVAPPIDIAAISRHENFRWVARKHYYTQELNVHG